MSRNDYFARVPADVYERVVRLRDLRPASRWQVFLLILLTSCRFGGRPAYLSVADIAAKTGLSARTVKAALADLLAAGLVRRDGRYKRLVVPLLHPPGPPTVPETPCVELHLPPLRNLSGSPS